MDYGARNFLQGLNDIANTILRDAAGIAQMRVQAARQKASAEVEMMTTDFMLKVERGEIAPEKFEEAWGEFEGGLQDYTENFSFGPAREIVSSDISAMMPKLKLNLGVAMNRMNLQAMEMDAAAAIDTIWNNPQLSLADKQAKVGEILSSTTLNPITKKKWELENTQRFQYEGVKELVRGMGTSEGLSTLNNPESELYQKTPINIRLAVSAELSKQLEENDKRADAEFAKLQDQLKGYFDPDPLATLDEFFAGKDISTAKKEEIAVRYRDKQIDAMYQVFFKQYNDAADSPARLQALWNELSVEGNLPGYGKLESWGHKQQLREELMNKIRGRLDHFAKSEANGTPATSKVDLRARLQQAALDLERGRKSLAFTLNALDAIRVEAWNADIEIQDEYQSIREGVLKWAPVQLRPYLESIPARIKDPKGSFSKLTRDEQEKIALDMEQRARNWALTQADPLKVSPADIEAFIKRETELWTSKDMEVARNLRFVSGTGGKDYTQNNISIGRQIDAGAFDQGVDPSALGGKGDLSISQAIQPALKAHLDWQKDIARNDFGLVITNQQVNPDGTIDLVAADGKRYYFRFGEKDYKLYHALQPRQKAENGASVPIEREINPRIPTIGEVSQRNIQAAARADQASAAAAGADAAIKAAMEDPIRRQVDMKAWPTSIESYKWVAPGFGSGLSEKIKEERWAAMTYAERQNWYAKAGYRWDTKNKRFVQTR